MLATWRHKHEIRVDFVNHESHHKKCRSCVFFRCASFCCFSFFLQNFNRILTTTITMPSPGQMRRRPGKPQKQLHFSEKRDRCRKCGRFLSEDDHRFCGKCTLIPDHVDDNTRTGRNIESPNEGEKIRNAEVVMVERGQFEDDNNDIEECNTASSSGNAGEERLNDFIWSDNDEDASIHSSFNGEAAEPFPLLLCHNCHRHSSQNRTCLKRLPGRKRHF
jgi:hypothetical protein